MPVVQKPGKQKNFLLKNPCFSTSAISDFSGLQNSLNFARPLGIIFIYTLNG
jgi:hypothetical protein